jgi:hypothetical protein
MAGCCQDKLHRRVVPLFQTFVEAATKKAARTLDS